MNISEVSTYTGHTLFDLGGGNTILIEPGQFPLEDCTGRKYRPLLVCKPNGDPLFDHEGDLVFEKEYIS